MANEKPLRPTGNMRKSSVDARWLLKPVWYACLAVMARWILAKAMPEQVVMACLVTGCGVGAVVWHLARLNYCCMTNSPAVDASALSKALLGAVGVVVVWGGATLEFNLPDVSGLAILPVLFLFYGAVAMAAPSPSKGS